MTEFRDIVAAHHGDSEAYLIVAREPCIRIAYDERHNVHGRKFHIVDPDDLLNVRPGRSWLAAVLLCPGDDTGRVAAWCQEHDLDPARFVFYVYHQADARAVLADWHDAGLPIRSTWTFRTWRELHKHFGNAWNLQVFTDFR